MKAGRELDALVAEKVMAWTRVEHFPDDDRGPHSDCVNGQRLDGAYTAVPFYSTGIAAAFEVVDRIIDIDGPYGEHKWSFGMEFSHVIDWVVDFTPRRNHPKSREYPAYQAQSVSRAHAICLAALKAVGAIE